jgi:hypothetical protein
MKSRRWLNPHQPQTLQIAVVLLYSRAAMALLFGGLFVPIILVIAAAGIAAGYGIANEQRWAYSVGIGVAALPIALGILFGGFGADIISLMFDVALVALLLHPQSRDYQRVWFS